MLEGTDKRTDSNQPEKWITKKKKIIDLQTQIDKATTDVTEAYHNAKVTAKSSDKNVTDGLLLELIQSASIKFNFPIDSIKKQTVYSRIRRKNLIGVAHEKISALHQIEPLLVE
jgi:hypothetical protein